MKFSFPQSIKSHYNRLMKSTIKLTATDIILIFIFISTFVVGFIFIGTDTEYNLNQKIARGYISRDSVFFEIDNPSYKRHIVMFIESDADGNVLHTYITAGADMAVDEDGVMVISTGDIDAEDPDFELANDTFSTGYTAIETLLSSGNTSYFASLHNGTLRGVFYSGDIDLPPLTSGRFFTSEECLTKKPLAIIGNYYKDLIYTKENRQYINYLGREYEVIGITGLSGSSPLDSMIFVNLGSLSAEEQLNGIYYIDDSSNNQAIYDFFSSQSQKLLGCNLKQRDIPTAQIDTISGGMYLKKYLRVIMVGLLLFTFINILVQTLRIQRSKIAILKVLGISNLKILISSTSRNLADILIGIVGGLIVVFILVFVEYFSLPVPYLINLSLQLFLISMAMLLTWIVVAIITIISIKPREVIQKI